MRVRCERQLAILIPIFGIFFLFTPFSAHAEEVIKFNRDIRQLISDNCFRCHGPDEAAREQGLRFDLEEGLFGKTEGGLEIIVPGKPEESEFYRRISHPNSDERMPPESSHLELSDDEIALLKKWIEQGASWEGHWAFVPPKKPELPSVSNPDWPRNGIDYFILNRLDDAGLTPSVEAPKETLIRRVSLDLTGLPPTPEEVDAFLADTSEDAYEKVVDRLLASPHYGERMAFVWLDAARYADTGGYQRDTKRYMWHWRDWVIQAYNDNMPFDRFTIEQLAGDLLPNPTLAQRVATGFNRNHRINGEGGIIPEEYAVEYVVDRIDTTSTTWMGLTMGCARCHDHKFDPFSQKEYYELYAFFNRVPENGKGDERGNDAPFIPVPTDEERAELDRLSGKIAKLEGELFAPEERLDRLQAEWEAELSERFAALDWRPVTPTAVSAENGTEFEQLDDGSILAVGDTPDRDVYDVTFEAPVAVRSLMLEFLLDDRLPESGPGRSSDGNLIVTGVEVYRATTDAAREAVTVVDALADYAAPDAKYHVDKAVDGDAASGWSTGSFRIRENRKAIFVLGDASIAPGDTVSLRILQQSEHEGQTIGRFRVSASASGKIGEWARPAFGEWRHVGPLRGEGDLFAANLGPEDGYDPERTYGDNNRKWTARPEWKDGELNAFPTVSRSVNYIHRTITAAFPTSVTLSLGSDDGIKVWLDGAIQLANDVGRDAAPDQERVTLSLSEGEHELLIKIVNGSGETDYYFRAIDDGGVELLSLMNEIARPAEKRDAESRRKLMTMFRKQDSAWIARNDELYATREELKRVEDGIVTTMVMEDMENPPDTYLLKRGVYTQPDTSEKLNASVPAVLGEMDEDLPANRLGLARWLVDPNHPLTARVRVNHYWQRYFGKGIVKTSEDFGTQGSPPSHFDLLDWLAVEFIESDWDVKAMQKCIVTSATYRQSSTVKPEHLQKDPANVLLARVPRFRLPAETIRDQALKVSGLLNPELGGPSVMPYQPKAMWSSLTFQNMDEYSTNFYTQDTGGKLYRRGLYTYWKRTIVPPRMQIFDAAGREQCEMRRETTNTPLQAMALLNDPTFVEAARHLAERMIEEGGDDPAERIRYGYKLALAYEPDAKRERILLDGLNDYRAHYAAQPDDASKLLTVGDSAHDESIPPDELAAYTMAASVMLNLDETITRE